MSKIDELIREFCPDGVEYKKLGDVCKFGNYKQLGASELEQLIVPGGNIPLMPSSANYDWMTTEEVASDYICDGELFSMGRARNANTKYVNGKFVSSNNFLIESANTSICLTRFIFHFVTANIKKIYVETSTYPKFDKEKFCNLSIPLPPIEIQQEIVRMLNSFTELEAELEAELTKRKQQYEFYRDQLLNFERERERSEVRWFTMQELCQTITTGKLNANAKKEGGMYPFFTCDANPFRIDEFAFDGESILVSGNGSQVGHINYYNGKFNAYQRTYVLQQFSDLIEVKFLLMYLKSYLKSYINTFAKKGSVPYITLPMLQKFKVPVPSKNEQIQIADILEKFDSLTTDISSGLPAEISARHQQYKYYRDKLLSFKEMNV